MDMQATSKSRARGIIASLFIASALLLGGGGSSSPVSELALQLVAVVAALAWLIAPAPPFAGNRPIDWRIIALAAITLALPVVQLLPLPPSIWQSLPGREIEKSALALIGTENGWMPWTMAPARTQASLLAMLPPMLAMVMISRLDNDDRDLAIGAVAAIAVASLLLGALQLSSGLSTFWRFYEDNPGFLNGFQANRNAEADVLLIGMIAGAAFIRNTRLGQAVSGNRWVLASLALLPLLGCVLTGSRTGVALIPVAMAAVAIIWMPIRFRLRPVLGVLAAVAALGSAAYLLLRHNTRIATALDRFANGRDFRLELWEDTRFAIVQYWPFGSGLGSFKPAFAAAERLEVVDTTVPVRAHNDYLELALEGGAFGLAVLALICVMLVWMVLSAWRSRDELTQPQIVFAVAAFLVVALHSVVDYPMRSMSLACVVGMAVGLLVPIRHSRR